MWAPPFARQGVKLLDLSWLHIFFQNKILFIISMFINIKIFYTNKYLLYDFWAPPFARQGTFLDLTVAPKKLRE